MRKAVKHFGSLPLYDEDGTTPQNVQTMTATAPQTDLVAPLIVEKEPMTLVSSEAVELGLWSESADELPSLNLDVPIVLEKTSSGPVTDHFQTMTASVAPTSGNDVGMSGKKKLAVGGLALLTGYFLLRD